MTTSDSDFPFGDDANPDDRLITADKFRRRAQDDLEGVPHDPGFEEVAPLIKKEYDGRENFVSKNDEVDLLRKDPALREIYVGAGWEQRSFEETADLDLSCFLLDNSGQTRVDEDFIFYNNENTLEGAVRHRGDSRTGAGEGDDESIFIDLNGLPFEVVQVVFALTIYDPDQAYKHFDLVRDLYVRLLNAVDDLELIRFELNEEDLAGHGGAIIFSLLREGPRWIFKANTEAVKDGLPAIAKRYGLLIKEGSG